LPPNTPPVPAQARVGVRIQPAREGGGVLSYRCEQCPVIVAWGATVDLATKKRWWRKDHDLDASGQPRAKSEADDRASG
jgi:hypothetical protein